jgi:hypothetical protein
MQEVIDFISNTPKPVATNVFKIWRNHPISWITVAVIASLILVVIIVILFMFAKKKTVGTTNSIIISMPSMKELETREAARDAQLEKY